MKLPRSPWRHTFLIIPLSTIYLTYWQIQRHFWKQKLKHEQIKIKNQEAQAVDDLRVLKNFDKVKLKGKLKDDEIILIGPKTYQSNRSKGSIQSVSGYEVILAMELQPNKQKILINCGFTLSTNYKPKCNRIYSFEAFCIKEDENVRWQKKSFIDGKAVFLSRDNKKLAQILQSEPICFYPVDFVLDRSLLKVSPLPRLYDHHLEYIIFWLTCSVASFITYKKKIKFNKDIFLS